MKIYTDLTWSNCCETIPWSSTGSSSPSLQENIFLIKQDILSPQMRPLLEIIENNLSETSNVFNNRYLLSGMDWVYMPNGLFIYRFRFRHNCIMGAAPILSIKQSVTISTIINFDWDIHWSGMCKQALKPPNYTVTVGKLQSLPIPFAFTNHSVHYVLCWDLINPLTALDIYIRTSPQDNCHRIQPGSNVGLRHFWCVCFQHVRF